MDRRVTATRLKNADEKFCAECGEVIRLRAEICPHCGVRQMPSPSTSTQHTVHKSERSKLAAGLIEIFLGGLGAHKFYLGSVGWGLIYLAFCWTFLPAVLGILEGLNYLLMSQKTFDKRY